MVKKLRTVLLSVCFVVGVVGLSYAQHVENVNFQDSSYSDATSYEIDDDSIIIYLEQVAWCVEGYGGGRCCGQVDTSYSVTLTSSTVGGGGITDSETFNVDYYAAGADHNKFRNATSIDIVFSPINSTTSNDGILHVEDGQTLTVSYTCQTKSDSDLATANVADDQVDDNEIIVRTDTTFGSGTILTGYVPNSSVVYIQVTDADENKKGYAPAETITVTVISETAGDSETLTLTETGNNTGVFQYTQGLVLTDGSGAADDTLQVSADADGDTIKISYVDSNDANDTASVTLNSNKLINDFSVSALATQIAGVPFAVTVTALKSGSATLTSYSGSVDLTLNYISPNSGTMTISPTSIATFVEGAAVVNITYGDAGSITITATDEDNSSLTGDSNSITMLPNDFTVATLGLDAANRHTVNSEFILTVTARNASSQITPNYRGTATLTLSNVSPSSDQSGSLNVTSLTSSFWSSGVAQFTNQTHDKWGTINIAASDNTLSTQTGVSSDIVFVPKDYAVEISDPEPSRTYFYTNESFSATVTVRDEDGATITNYLGTILFTGSGLNLPSDYTFTAQDAGVHTFSGINGSSSATTTLTVKDTAYTTITGESSDITIKSGTIKVIDAVSTVGTPKSISVKIVDESGVTLTEDDSTTFKVILTGSATSDATASDVTVSGGTATVTITDDVAEVVTVMPTDVSPEMDVLSGVCTFGSVAFQNLRIIQDRELTDPMDYEDK